MTNVPIVVAFTAGLISFLSPCVLPLIPGFLAYLAGSSMGDVSKKRLQIFLNSGFFVLGFSVVFALLGILLNTILSQVAYSAQQWLAWGGGVVIIFFGLYLTGLLQIPFLQREYKMSVTKQFASRYVTSFLFGAAFAAGWTPCVGAVLGSILGLAATQPGSAFVSLLAYSTGLGLPFLLVGLFTAQAAAIIQRYSCYVPIVNAIFGVFLIILGILVFTQNLSLVANVEVLNNWLLK